MAAAMLLALGLLVHPAPVSAYEGEVERRDKPPEPHVPVLTKPPQLLRFVEATYPEEAIKDGLTGEVVLQVDIAADGSVADAQVTGGAGHGFDEAALAAVKQFGFSPAEIDGAPAPVRIEYRYHFVLKEKPPEPEQPKPPPPVTFHGRIIERGSRTPIAGASVSCKERDEAAVTDADGAFELRAPAGPCTATVISYGHQTFTRLEQLEEGKVLEVTYHLMPTNFGLYSTVVRGEREKREAVVRSMEREELQKVPGSFGDPIRAIQNMPGVARMPYGAGFLLVRGALPQETGAYMDSVEIPLLFHLLGGPSVVNPEFLDKLDFFPGGFGPGYGRAIGGIVDAGTRRGTPTDYHGSFKIDFLDSAAFAEAAVSEKLSVAFAGRRSYIDLLLPHFLPNDPRTGAISVLPRYWDYQARLDYGQKGDKNVFTLMAFGSDDNLAVVASGGQRDREFALSSHTNFHRLRANWLWHDGAWSNLFAPYLGRDATDTTFGSGDAALGGNVIQPGGGLRDELAVELDGGSKIRLGADWALFQSQFNIMVPQLGEYRRFPGSDSNAPPEKVQRSVDDFDFGFYLTFEARLTPSLLLIPGLRLDQIRLGGHPKSATDPRLTVRWGVTEATTLKGAVGHYSQAPQAFYLDSQFGNPDLELNKAFQSSLGVEHKITPAISVDVTGFYNRRYDIAVATGKTVTGDDGLPHPLRYVNDGLGRAYGVELMLRHEITANFFGWLSYTLSRSEQRNRGGGDYQLSPYDQPHILTLVAQYKMGNGWEFGGRFRLVSGMPSTPIVGSTYDADRQGYSAIGGEVLSTREPTFHQLDLRVDKGWLFNDWKLGVYLDVQNVYNANNPEGYQWDYRYRTRSEIPGIPFLPTLGIKGSF